MTDVQWQYVNVNGGSYDISGNPVASN